jgi:hypothetical protein
MATQARRTAWNHHCVTMVIPYSRNELDSSSCPDTTSRRFFRGYLTWSVATLRVRVSDWPSKVSSAKRRRDDSSSLESDEEDARGQGNTREKERVIQSIRFDGRKAKLNVGTLGSTAAWGQVGWGSVRRLRRPFYVCVLYDMYVYTCIYTTALTA